MSLRSHKVLYKGTHYHCDKDSHLKQESVRFRKLKNRNKQYVIHVGPHIRTFSEEEFCFFELEEIELATVEEKQKKPFTCIKQKTQDEEYTNFQCLTIVIYKVGDNNSDCMFKGSNRIKLFDKVEPGTTSKLKKLERILYKYFGFSMNQWFMKNIEDNNNEQPVRVILRKTNFSVLDEKLNVLHFHRLRRLEIKECLVNPLQRSINMKIVEDSSQIGNQHVHNINLRSSMTGDDIVYSFRTKLCNQIHEIHQNEQFNIQMAKNPNLRVMEWIQGLQKPNKGRENINLVNDWFVPSMTCYSEDRMNSFENLILESTVPSVIPVPCQVQLPCENSDSHCGIDDVEQKESSVVSNPPLCCSLLSSSHNDSSTLDSPPCCSLKLPTGDLIRSESVDDLFLCTCHNMNMCNNIMEESKCSNSNTSCDDSDYQKIYYKNVGWVKCCKNKVLMCKRIKRHRYMDFHISDVSFETVNKHEQWWDNDFKTRAEDEIYRRTALTSKSINHAAPSAESEDMYWNGDLCLTVQLLMERKGPKISSDLDLSWSQTLAVIIHLSLDQQPACFRKDWRDFAELLGLKNRDIEIIQHFCYAHREWPARVVLCHWKLLTNKGRSVPTFNFYNLRQLLLELGRHDILKIIDYSDTNYSENSDESKMITYL